MTLSKKQLTAIGANAIAVKMMLTYPEHMVKICGNSAWIAVIWCAVWAFVLFCLTRVTCTARAGVIETAEAAGGKPLKIAVGLSVFCVLVLNILGTAREFPEIIRLVLLQDTYTEYIGAAFAVAAVLAALCGIEAIARIHEIFIPIAGAMFVIFLALLFPSFEAENIVPIFGKGISNVFVSGMSGLSIFSDLILLNLLLSRSKSLDDYKSGGNGAIVMGGIFAAVILLSYGMCYVYPASEQFITPLYQLERLIHLSNFFSRFEAVFHFTWSICILLYAGLYLAVAARVWQVTFGLRYSRPLIVPIAGLILIPAIIPHSLTAAIRLEESIGNWLYVPAFGIPIVVNVINLCIGCSKRSNRR